MMTKIVTKKIPKVWKNDRMEIAEERKPGKFLNSNL